MKLILIIIMFFFIGAFFIISEHNLSLKNSGTRIEFGNLYLNWFKQIFENSKDLMGYIVKLDWLPGNSTG